MPQSTLVSLAPMLLLLVWAAIEDLRIRRIRNWLTVSMAIGGLARSVISGGAAVTPSQALFGLLVGFAIPFVLFAIGALGGGDVKLLAGIGAWIGPEAVLAVFAVAAILGLVIVLIQCAVKGRLFELFRNSALLAINVVHIADVGVEHAAETGRTCRSVDRPLPYAIPLLGATVIVIWKLM